MSTYDKYILVINSHYLKSNRVMGVRRIFTLRVVPIESLGIPRLHPFSGEFLNGPTMAFPPNGIVVIIITGIYIL